MQTFKKYFLPSFFIIFIVLAFLTLASPAQASILPACISDGRCGVCDLVQTAVNIGGYLLSLVGAVTLLFFVYGGVMMLISGGDSNKIKQGKDILINAVIGLAIALLAYTIVSFVISAVTGGWSWEGKLNCAPLPPPHIDNPPVRDPGPTADPNAKSCTESKACEAKEFCNATGKCQAKLISGSSCIGKTIEAKEYADKNGITESAWASWLPTVMAGDTLEVLILSNNACNGGDCNAVNINGFGKCDIASTGDGTIAEGGACIVNDDCLQGYCAKSTKKCAGYAAFGDQCEGLSTDNDNYVCHRDKEVSLCDGDAPLYRNDIYGAFSSRKSGNLLVQPTGKCVPGKAVGTNGDFCTLSNQCASLSGKKLFCACDGYDGTNTQDGQSCTFGTCKEKAAATYACEDWVTYDTRDDNIVCLNGDCNDRGPSYCN